MEFAGDKKFGASILNRAETRMKEWLVPKVPKCVETYHLTLTTVLWSLLIIVFSFFARYGINWLWLVSLMIFLQYINILIRRL